MLQGVRNRASRADARFRQSHTELLGLTYFSVRGLLIATLVSPCTMDWSSDRYGVTTSLHPLPTHLHTQFGDSKLLELVMPMISVFEIRCFRNLLASALRLVFHMWRTPWTLSFEFGMGFVGRGLAALMALTLCMRWWPWGRWLSHCRHRPRQAPPMLLLLPPSSVSDLGLLFRTYFFSDCPFGDSLGTSVASLRSGLEIALGWGPRGVLVATLAGVRKLGKTPPYHQPLPPCATETERVWSSEVRRRARRGRPSQKTRKSPGLLTGLLGSFSRFRLRHWGWAGGEVRSLPVIGSQSEAHALRQLAWQRAHAVSLAQSAFHHATSSAWN